MKKFQLYDVEPPVHQKMLEEVEIMENVANIILTPEMRGGGHTHDEWLLDKVKHFQEEILLKPAKSNKFLDIWLYTQGESEYKPVMNYVDKGNHLFIIVFLKFPEHIEIEEAGVNNVNKTGGLDLVLPERQQYIPPKPGTAIIMRSNVYHTIYPFKGPGQIWCMKALIKCEGWEDYE